MVGSNPLNFWLFGIITLIGTFWGSALLEAAFSESVDSHSLKQFLGHTLVKYGLLWFFASGFIWITVSQTRYVHVVLRALIWVSAINFFYCLAQRQFGINWVKGFDAFLPSNRFAYDVYRVSGFTSHPLTLGYQLCVLLVFSMGLALSRRFSDFERKLCLTSALLFFMTILISGSRGPQVVALVSLFFVTIGSLGRRSLKVVLPVAFIMILVGLWAGAFERFFEIGALGSGDRRLLDWKAYTKAFFEHPFLGLGPAGFAQAILAYYDGGLANDNIRLAHNMFLQVAGELGLVGLLGLCAWMMSWVLCVRRLESRQYRYSFLGFFVVMLLSSCTQNSLRDSGVLFTLTICSMILYSTYYSDEKIEQRIDSPTDESQNYQSG